MALPLFWDAPAFAGCQAYNSTPTFSNGQPIPDVCDTHGARKVMTVDANGDYVAGGGGGGGDASAANQVTLASVTADLLAVSRPQNSLYDKGAYEYVVSAGGGSGGQLQDPAWDSPRRSPFWRR